jgi:hypothetical protein
MHLSVQLWLWKISFETHVAGGKPDDFPPPPASRFLFDSDWPDLPPVVLDDSGMDGQ